MLAINVEFYLVLLLPTALSFSDGVSLQHSPLYCFDVKSKPFQQSIVVIIMGGRMHN